MSFHLDVTGVLEQSLSQGTDMNNLMFRRIPLTLCEGQIRRGLDQSRGKEVSALTHAINDEERRKKEKQADMRGIDEKEK